MDASRRPWTRPGRVRAFSILYSVIECPALTSTRNKHFTASSMKDLFDNVAARNIISFIKESHFIALYNFVTIILY